MDKETEAWGETHLKVLTQEAGGQVYVPGALPYAPIRPLSSFLDHSFIHSSMNECLWVPDIVNETDRYWEE